MYIYIYVCIYVFVYVFVYVCMYIYIIYIHIHIQMLEAHRYWGVWLFACVCARCTRSLLAWALGVWWKTHFSNCACMEWNHTLVSGSVWYTCLSGGSQVAPNKHGHCLAPWRNGWGWTWSRFEGILVKGLYDAPNNCTSPFLETILSTWNLHN